MVYTEEISVNGVTSGGFLLCPWRWGEMDVVGVVVVEEAMGVEEDEESRWRMMERRWILHMGSMMAWTPIPGKDMS
jgi:hypothetical protein